MGSLNKGKKRSPFSITSEMICTKFGSSPLWPCCSCTAGLLTTPVGIQSGVSLNLIFRQRHPPAVTPPTRSFSHTQHPLLSHPRLPRAHSDILRWDTAAAWTESSASWTGLGTLGSLKEGTHGVGQPQACRLPAHQAQRPHQHLEKTKPVSKHRASMLSQCWAS